MLLSNGNGSFEGGKVTLKEGDSVPQGIKWGKWAWTGGQGDGIQVRRCLKRQAFCSLKGPVPRDCLNQESVIPSESEEYLSCLARNQFMVKEDRGSEEETGFAVKYKGTCSKKGPAPHFLSPWSNPRATEPCSLLLPGSNTVETAFFFFFLDFNTISAGAVKPLFTGKC